MSEWIEEQFTEYFSMKYKIKERLFSQQSDFQKVEVVASEGHGNILLNDGLVMVSERDEFCYHDMITHVPLFTAANPTDILVIGGGDGGTVREVLKHESVRECVLVEIDGAVIEACQKFIPQTACKLDDPRVKVIVDDGVKYIKETPKTFDVIIVDSTEPFGPAAPLFNEEFYQNVKKRLKPDGLVVSQADSPFYHPEIQQSLFKILNKVFPQVYAYNYANMTYPGGLWTFALSGLGPCPVTDLNKQRIDERNFEYYNHSIHLGAFMLPSFQRRNLEGLINNP